MRNCDWFERETVNREPLIGSGSEERENGIRVRVCGSTTEVMERDRVSRKRGPVWGEERERRAEERMVEEGKSK